MYDLGDPEKVFPDGSPIEVGHREQPVRLTMDGEPGTGNIPIMDRGGVLPT